MPIHLHEHRCRDAHCDTAGPGASGTDCGDRHCSPSRQPDPAHTAGQHRWYSDDICGMLEIRKEFLRYGTLVYIAPRY